MSHQRASNALQYAPIVLSELTVAAITCLYVVVARPKRLLVSPKYAVDCGQGSNLNRTQQVTTSPVLKRDALATYRLVTGARWPSLQLTLHIYSLSS